MQRKKKPNKYTRNYAGSPNYDYFLLLSLQFYYDDDELQEMIT